VVGVSSTGRPSSIDAGLAPRWGPLARLTSHDLLAAARDLAAICSPLPSRTLRFAALSLAECGSIPRSRLQLTVARAPAGSRASRNVGFP
jgi:hypothetical protein